MKKSEMFAVVRPAAGWLAPCVEAAGLLSAGLASAGLAGADVAAGVGEPHAATSNAPAPPAAYFKSARRDTECDRSICPICFAPPLGARRWSPLREPSPGRSLTSVPTRADAAPSRITAPAGPHVPRPASEGHRPIPYSRTLQGVRILHQDGSIRTQRRQGG